MSRILPLHLDNYDIENEEMEGICPRYIKWTKKVKAFDFSKRKKVTIERSMHSFDLKHKIENDINTSPKKSSSKSIFSRIRRGGQNLKVRCKTSAELWRRWIRGGIYYDTNHKIVEETVEDEKDTNAESVCKKTDVIIENNKNLDQNIEKKTDNMKKIDEKQDKSDEKQKKTDEQEKSDEKQKKSDEQEKSDEKKQEVIEPEITNIVSMPEVVAHNE